MKTKNFSEMSIEELEKNLKTLQVVTGILAGMLTVLFVMSILVIKQDGYALIIVPIALSSIVFINFGSIQKIKKDLKTRN